MKIRSNLTCGFLILTLGFLVGCVQRGEFRSFQGEVRRGLNHQEQQTQELRHQVADLQKRLEANEADRDTLRKQLADHMNDLTLLRQEVAAIRGEVETSTHKRHGGVSELRKSQEALRQQLQALQLRMDSKFGPSAPPVLPTPPPQPTPSLGGPEELYKHAKSDFDSANYPKAREGFSALLEQQPKSALADNAQFWIGECYFREGNFKKAILEYEKVISQYPNSTKIPSALLKQGMAFEKLGDLESARYLYRKITKEFPNSDQAPAASHNLKRLP